MYASRWIRKYYSLGSNQRDGNYSGSNALLALPYSSSGFCFIAFSVSLTDRRPWSPGPYKCLGLMMIVFRAAQSSSDEARNASSI